MTNDLIKYGLIIFLSSLVLTSCANAQNISNNALSTDEAVRRELEKNSEFKSKLDRLCVERIKEWPTIIVVGTHANDRDCELDGAFVNSRYLGQDDHALSQNALNELGWKTASKEQREQLAKLWVEKGLLAFFTVLYARDKDFNPYRGITYRGGNKPNFPDFHPPKVVSIENGDLVVTVWVSFMRREKMYRHHEFRFTKDGSLSEN